MVMEVQPRRLSLRSALDVELARMVGRHCADVGVKHKTFVRAALEHAMEDERVAQRALEHEAAVAEARHKLRSRRHRYYRNRKLL